MSRQSKTKANKQSRQNRVRTKLRTISDLPRLSVVISNTNVYAQIIDDQQAKTLASANSLKIKSGTMTEKAEAVGLEIAKAAKKAKLSKVVIDRGSRKYHGRIKALTDKARSEGLEV